MVVGLTPTYAYAELTAGTPASQQGVQLTGSSSTKGETRKVDNWAGLLNAIMVAQNGDVIQLTRNVDYEDGCNRIEIKNRTLTIDLAGYTLDRKLADKKDNGHVIELYEGTTLTIVDTSPQQTGAITGGYAKNGGGISVKDGATLNIEGGSILRNKSASGGGVYVENGATLNIRGGTIANNTASESGGGIYVEKGGKATLGDDPAGTDSEASATGTGSGESASGNASNSGTIASNHADDDGAGIYVSGTLNMTGGIIDSNEASKSGGGIYVSSGGDIHLSRTVIRRNIAGLDGGGVCVKLNDEKSTIANCEIQQNQSSRNGGAVSSTSDGGTLKITDTDIKNNESSNDGGGINLYEGTIEMERGSLVDNISSKGGGGANVERKGTFTANRVTISGNKAETEEGGGIKNIGMTVIQDCTVSNNSSTSNGGGVYSGKTLTVKGTSNSENSTKVVGNTAQKGGGIYIGTSASATNIEGSLYVMDNTTVGDGKGFFLRSGQKLTLSGPLGSIAQMGVTMEDDVGTFTTGYKSHNSADPDRHFYSPEGFSVGYDADKKEAQLFSSWENLQSDIDKAQDDGRVVLSGYTVAASRNDSLKIPENKRLTIDLVGHTLNRNLSEPKEDGYVIEVKKGAELTIEDSSSNKTGKITGGFSLGFCGGILVDEGATLTLKGITISGNKAYAGGGGIFVMGKLRMEGGAISGNVAGTKIVSSGNGGGIYVSENGTINLDGVIITKNRAENLGYGGGVFFASKVVPQSTENEEIQVVKNCKITDNYTGGMGGGLCVNADSGGLAITDTTIVNNSSFEGGGVFLQHGAIDMKRGSLESNKASTGGGAAVYGTDANTIFKATSVEIKDNQAAKGSGGGVANFGRAEFNKCSITGNTAAKSGGGIESSGTLMLIGGSDTQSALNISGNTAVETGGGICITKDAVYTSIQGAIVATGNTAAFGKDLYLASGRKLTLEGKIDHTNIGSMDMESIGAFTIGFSSNNSNKDPEKFFSTEPGAIPAGWTDDKDEAQLIPEWPGLQKKINEASKGNGRVKLDKSYTACSSDINLIIPKGTNITIDLSGYTLDRNLPLTREDGCVIKVESDATLTIEDSSPQKAGTITGGNSIRGGGVIVDAGATFNLNSGAIKGNKAKEYGGGVYALGKLIMTGGSIEENEAYDMAAIICGGGGVHAQPGAVLEIKGGSISRNKSSLDGGGIYTFQSLEMTGGVIEGNEAGESGGGIYVASNCTKISLSNATVSGNTAGDSGGGIHMKQMVDSSITDCTISGNKASNHGGGLLVDTKHATLTIAGTTIEGNVSGKAGAGIRLRVGSIVMKKSEPSEGGSASSASASTSSGNISTVSGNISSTDAGGIDIDSDTTFVATDVEIFNNLAGTGPGGGVKNYGTATLESCKVFGNSAKRQGGGVANFGVMELGSCAVRGNSAEGGGGGVYSGKTLTIVDGRFSANSTQERGGGIYVDLDSKATNITGGLSVEGNTANCGASNVFLREGQKLTITEKLAASASIGVDLETGTGTFTEGYNAHHEATDPNDLFFTSKGLDIKRDNDGEAQIANDWESIKNKIEKAADGELVPLDKDYAASSSDKTIKIPANKSVTVDLNGYTLNRNCITWDKYGSVFEVLGTLTLVDTSDKSASGGSSGTGAVTGGWSDVGGGINIAPGGTLNLQGGAITCNKASSMGGGIYVQGTLNMQGGIVEANESKPLPNPFGEVLTRASGGGIYLAEGGALNLEGGTVTGNSTDGCGGGIMMEKIAATSIMGNPVVWGNRASAGGHDIFLPSGSRLSVKGTLTEKARMGIDMEDECGQFTRGYDIQSFNNSEDPSVYFTSNQGHAVIEEEGEAALGQDAFGKTDYEDPFIAWNDQVKINVNTLSSQNWMSGISGERYLNEINMPGSHDSGMKNVEDLSLDYTGVVSFFSQGTGTFFATTQTEDIDQQLADGARQLDLRLNDCYKEKRWYGYGWADDGENLWIAHGTNSVAGTYLASNPNGDNLSFSQVLGWVKDFLKKHPTETIIISIRPETCLSGHDTIIYQRARRILEVMMLEVNPSTGEPYLYKESGSSSYFAKYDHMPQLKDCRGKIVLIPKGEEGLETCGGFHLDSFKTLDYKDPTNYTLTFSEKIAEVEREYGNLNVDGKVGLPADLDSECNSLWYWELNCTGEDKGIINNYVLGNNNPIANASFVNPALIGDGKLFSSAKAGQYIGWVRMDAFEAKYAEPIWRTNFFDELHYCTVTVEPDLGAPYTTQTFEVLKGTKITVPGNIYKDENGSLNGRFLNGWKADGEHTDTVCYPGVPFTVDEDVTFTAEWLEKGQIPVRVVWKDGDNADKLRPDSVILDVYAGDNAGEGDASQALTSVTLMGEKWNGVIAGNAENTRIIPRFDALNLTDGNAFGQDAEGQYRYAMKPVAGSGYTFTFYHTPLGSIPISGTVSWDDGDNVDKLRPEDATIRLFAKGKEVDFVKAKNGADGIWRYNFGSRQQYENGEIIEYSISEDAIPGYTAAFKDFAITNMHVPGGQSDVNVIGIVEWDDVDNVKGKRPDSVKVHLSGGVETSTQEVRNSSSGYWSFSFDGCPIIDSNEQRIDYAVTVDDVSDYTCKVEKTASYAFRVTYVLDVSEQDKVDASVEEAPKAIEPTYNGKAQSLVQEGSGKDGTMLYALGSDDKTEPADDAFSTEVPEGTDAGTYYVWYYVKGDVLHKDTKKECVTVQIAPLGVTVTVASTSKVAGQADPGFTGRVEGLIKEGDLGKIEYFRTNLDEAVGVYEGALTAKYTPNANYDVTVVNGDFTIVAKEKGVYNVTSGAGGIWTRGSGETINFKVERTVDPETAFGHFIGLEVDGVRVPEKDASGNANYTAVSGSVVIDLMSSFLDALGDGQHNMTALFDDGDGASAQFSVTTKAVPGPDDGNESPSSGEGGGPSDSGSGGGSSSPGESDESLSSDEGGGSSSSGEGGGPSDSGSGGGSSASGAGGNKSSASNSSNGTSSASNSSNGASSGSEKSVSAKTGDATGAVTAALALMAAGAFCLLLISLYLRRKRD